MADRPSRPVNNRAPLSIPVRRHPLPAVPGYYGRPGCRSLMVNPTCAGEQATKSAWPYPAPVISSRSPRRTYRRFARFGGHFFWLSGSGAASGSDADHCWSREFAPRDKRPRKIGSIVGLKFPYSRSGQSWTLTRRMPSPWWTGASLLSPLAGLHEPRPDGCANETGGDGQGANAGVVAAAIWPGVFLLNEGGYGVVAAGF